MHFIWLKSVWGGRKKTLYHTKPLTRQYSGQLGGLHPTAGAFGLGYYAYRNASPDTIECPSPDISGKTNCKFYLNCVGWAKGRCQVVVKVCAKQNESETQKSVWRECVPDGLRWLAAGY